MRRGFSLAETILGFAMISLVVVLVVNLVPSSMATVRTSEQRYRAETLAGSVLEEKSGLPFQQLPVGLVQDMGAQIYDQVAYQIYFQVSSSDGDPQYLRALRVSVEWNFKRHNRKVVREVLVHHLPGP